MNSHQDFSARTPSEPSAVSRPQQTAPVTRFYSHDCWIEGAAEQQITHLSTWQGMQALAAFPDLHPGKHGPVGMACLADRLFPQLIGNDIGCGIAVFQLDIPAHKLSLRKAADAWTRLEQDRNADTAAALRQADLPPDLAPLALGSLGGGNHFCELQSLSQTWDTDLTANTLFLMVHTGSRGLGNAILAQYQGQQALDPSSASGRAYLTAHDQALRWARLNREMMARRAARLLKAELRLLADVPHNLLVPHQDAWLHRKGAAQLQAGMLPLAGSRDTASYIVQADKPNQQALASFSHGAGRKRARGQAADGPGARGKSAVGLSRNQQGGFVLAGDKQALQQETGQNYKDVDTVLQALLEARLVRPLAKLKPLVTYKSAPVAPTGRHRA